MALVILQFDQPLVLPVDAAGLTISDNNGGTFTASSVAFGANNKLLEYTGTWSPDDPVNGVDVVRVQYDKATGAIIGTGGMIVESFNVVASYTVDAASFLNVAPVSASLSYRSFGSMDLTQTLQAPLNRAAPEFNTTRF